MERYEPIITELGKIEGRDAIYLDGLKQDFSPSLLTFVGEINGRLCTKNDLKHQWYAYKAIFMSVEAYECQWIDICKWDSISSFDEVHESAIIEKLGLPKKGLHHYIFSTYDYIYSIIAKKYEMKITGGR